ncbi:hypothetical protein [Parasphingopyxis marina]|uniref:DUF3618 domain-containing protein n=1 Tax=Parasphingopyxis marina TaxID=2761622 RepID=A0A842I1W5_9SPHN|nr:hypothetical protein [Parasphingopyxis marina]MBC2777764.1 hypothetical protein [Parasphingopyxis marina]
MKTAEQRLADAKIEERLARSRWFDSVETAQARATPANIADEAFEQVKEHAARAAAQMGNAVRKRPGTLIAAGTAIGLLLFRRPIAKAVTKTLRSHREKRAETRAQAAKKPKGVRPRPDPTPKQISEEV